jgi:hypothetical protein
MLYASFSKLKYIIWINVLFVLWYGGQASAKEDGIQWLEIETRHTIIRYQSSRDLNNFDKKIDYSPVPSSGLNWLNSSTSGNNSRKDKIKKKVDAIYRRVQDILEMRKRMKKKVKINIYQNSNQLKKAYFNIYKEEGKYRAWYIYELNTIYININDLHEGMLAHEMAHSIIDHYLTVRPPSASAEILARYVDSHLLE